MPGSCRGLQSSPGSAWSQWRGHSTHVLGAPGRAGASKGLFRFQGETGVCHWGCPRLRRCSQRDAGEQLIVWVTLESAEWVGAEPSASVPPAPPRTLGPRGPLQSQHLTGTLPIKGAGSRARRLDRMPVPTLIKAFEGSLKDELGKLLENPRKETRRLRAIFLKSHQDSDISGPSLKQHKYLYRKDTRNLPSV